MPIPRPVNDDQVAVLSAIWRLFIERSAFPTFRQLDRRTDNDLGLDAFEIIQSMPDGLIYGTRTPSDSDTIGVTIAGATYVPGSRELLDLFVAVVRYAADLHRTWSGPPVEATDDATFKGAALPQVVQMPASGRDDVLRCLQALLQNEQWGWSSASAGLDWTFTVDRRVRAFRGVVDVADYLSRIYGSDATEPTLEEPSVASEPAISPTERLSIVDRLAKMAGSDSRAFFAAFGLDAAYQSAGQASSKKAHINAALAEAEREGNVDEILRRARDLVEPTAEAPAPEAVQTRPRNPAGGPAVADLRIFISHASADRELAGALKNALILAGVPRDRIFFSSQRSTGVPAGKDIRQHLREQLADSGFVIELLTPTFLQRPMCLLELGAAWALNKSTYPIVVPPLTISGAKEAVGDVLMGQFASDDEIDEIFGDLADTISEQLGVHIRRQDLGDAMRFFKSAFHAQPAHPPGSR